MFSESVFGGRAAFIKPTISGEEQFHFNFGRSNLNEDRTTESKRKKEERNTV